MRRPGRLVALLVVALAVGGAPRAGHSALPAPPFELAVAPSPLRVGERGVLRLAADGGGPAAATDRVDIYVVRFVGRAPVNQFLTPAGTWSPALAPYRQGVAASAFAPALAEWQESGPAGWISVVVVFVKTSANPLHRENWRFRPLMTRVRVRPPPAGSAFGTVSVLGPLGLLTLAACAAVVRYRS